MRPEMIRCFAKLPEYHTEPFLLSYRQPDHCVGKSDGVDMLDILNNFNLRNPTIFEEENIKIPVWAANMNWQPWVGANLQLLWMPQWFPTYWPGCAANNEPVEGGYHDWTYGVVSDFNNFYNGQFGFKVPVTLHTPTIKPQDWIGGARWERRHRWSQLYPELSLYLHDRLH